MQPLTIFAGCLIVLASALVAPCPPSRPVHITNRSLDFGADLINKINSFPGSANIKVIFTCMKKDHSWKADWSKEKEGKVTFSSIDSKCCEKTEKGWEQYKSSWDKLAVATFNQPCNGGELAGLTPENARRLHHIMGDHENIRKLPNLVSLIDYLQFLCLKALCYFHHYHPLASTTTCTVVVTSVSSSSVTDFIVHSEANFGSCITYSDQQALYLANMQLTSILAALIGAAGIMAYSSQSGSEAPADDLSLLREALTPLSDLGEAQFPLSRRGDHPSRLWPKPLRDDWRCMKAAGVKYPDVHGDWSRKSEGIHTSWGFPTSCCRPFAKAWKEREAAGKTRGIHAEFSNTKKTGDADDCDRVVMSKIKRHHWPYLNRFWKDFGVFEGQE
ncbi:hypothetical protein M406DRAFT_75079 [Cryphonectria parasitica EP155]|uniref:Uncharacterized protein n=1 Tax=Cryphonectria parasitica (strain ATCC 38755 / EP155) TaxID=660469 RepID=A0A9P4XZM0_CRYP1|nr:uncharacterized protein M406DRAFT_75079 [Cryphonectria parasitica EP155]KAF3763846.1 hypothetical protein M406DRAFT_75079 [Cryphonectria parasitica EP155]